MPPDIPRLQPITKEDSALPILEQVKAFCQGGVEWVQLRLKEVADEEFLEIGREVREITRSEGVSLILDDRVNVVKELEAEGVHLGEKDMAPSKAREILGKGCIIGGTADRFERVEELASQGVDYIGCGPFRYTSSKKELSPVLGLEGYRDILYKMEAKGIEVPLLAIGGIRLEDLPELLALGVHGIALSGAITEAEDPIGKTGEFLDALNRA